MRPIQEIYNQLTSPRKVVITMHQKPDPDAMGSSLALYHFLRQFGHTVTVVSPTNWAGFLNWMPGCDTVLDFESPKGRTEVPAILQQAEWLFCLDFNTLPRTKTLAAPLKALNCVKVLIDHHQQPEVESFDYGVSDTSKSSTSEMVYDFIVGSGHGDKINTDMAECLYAGVIGDTGSFRFPAATAAVHTMVAHLKEVGLQHTQVHENIYDNYLENRLRFIGHVLSNRMEIMYEYNTALIAISKGDLLRFEIKTGDTEGLVNFPLSIQGIKMVGLVIDRDEERKWSFRSKGSVDVNTFARKYFEGGGHFNASGGHTNDSLDQTVKKFKQAVKENALQLQ
ncbi:DHH family phosphoesterase [Pinibacter soli]|uniref:Bifunctional oligoribonuclease/PAP phosphatase NrnA n=1 Tax=Pinibacter soli TaxID=3044211 RepID=A0ABT6RBT9_9BACT|nr:bifunctional oligoribonuclease/PAP phosphatase NrnA [Pinibacter soli]MDI3319367.1 bifunctional oligoribonuclease/PAP phosphatase NrnA [Pinibacter soli]